jgi:MFS superfamily sulfate permease-like transporter
LAIALASGAPLFSGIISGIIGGVLVGLLSQSHVSVSGPAAGLTAIVLTSIQTLGSFELFLTAVVIAGVLQLLLALIKAGTISNYFPSNVIEGMLTGIGIIIIIKQIPLVLAYDSGNKIKYWNHTNLPQNFILDLIHAIHPGALMVSILSGLLLIGYHKIPFLKLFKAGDRQRFIQLCNTQVDSIVQGTINFDKASVSTIKECKMTMRIIADTIRDYKVETFNSKNTKKLLSETIEKYGQPRASKNDIGETVYFWKDSFHNQFIVSSLTISTGNKKGLLTSRIE